MLDNVNKNIEVIIVNQSHNAQIEVIQSSKDIEIKVEKGINHYEEYSGSYSVTPRAHSDTVLETNGKVMTDNVTVFEIPYWETSNISGLTVYIANEV